jgi:oxygen-independent coproporphyrinogen-3 oxidase
MPTPLPGLYLHVPFCRKKCPYCDFYSTTDRSLIPRWLTAVQKEAAIYRHTFPAFDTVYVGGGSPSQLPREALEELLLFLNRTFSLIPGTEITLEANPHDLDPALVKGLMELGIHRISLGVQSFHDDHLKRLGRAHTASQVVRLVDWIREAGWIALGLDLLYGLPGQTLEQWRNDLEKAAALRPEHLSCYQLTYSPGTLFGVLKEKGKVKPLSEEEEGLFFLFTSRFLQDQGYIHYEISNFAREEKHRSRHNQKYWRRIPYLGLGPSAHSFLGNRRWWNVRSLHAYCRAAEEGRPPLEGEEILDEEQVRLERISLGMRTREGVDLEVLGDLRPVERILDELVRKGLCLIKEGRLVPTTKGFLLADRIPLYL